MIAFLIMLMTGLLLFASVVWFLGHLVLVADWFKR